MRQIISSILNRTSTRRWAILIMILVFAALLLVTRSHSPNQHDHQDPNEVQDDGNFEVTVHVHQKDGTINKVVLRKTSDGEWIDPWGNFYPKDSPPSTEQLEKQIFEKGIITNKPN